MQQGYKQTEVGVIPKDWDYVQFGEKVKIYRGGSPRPIQNYITTSSDGINWIKIGDVGENDKYIHSTKEKIIAEGVSKSREVHVGDFILSNSMSFGRPYILDIDGCIHDGWLTIQDYKNTFDTEYLYYLLSSEQVYQQYLSMAAGSSVKNLNKDKVSALNVVYPSIPEQKRIAEALSDVDSMISSLEKLVAKKKAIKQGAMQELLTGKKRLPGFTAEWIEKKIDDIIIRFATGLNPRQNFKLNNGGTNYYVTIKDFRDGRLFLDESCDRIDDAALTRINERSDLKTNDLLFSSIGRIGDAYLITETPKNWNINESVFALRPNLQIIYPLMLFYLLTSEDIKNKLLDSTTGSTLKSIKLGHLKEIFCRFPQDIGEQIAISSILSDMDNEIESLEQKLAKARQVKQGMMQQLLTGKIRLV